MEWTDQDIIYKKTGFPYSSSERLDTRVQTWATESKSSMKVWMAQQILNFESKSPEEVRTTQHTRATESTCLHEGPDTNAMTANVGSTLRNARIAGPNTLLFLPEVLVIGPNARNHVRMPPKEIQVYVKLGISTPI